MQANLDSAEDKAAESADHVGNIRASLDEERDMTKQLRAQASCNMGSLLPFMQSCFTTTKYVAQKVELLESQQRKLESEHGEKEAHLQDQVSVEHSF